MSSLLKFRRDPFCTVMHSTAFVTGVRAKRLTKTISCKRPKGYEAGGREFESLRARHLFRHLAIPRDPLLFYFRYLETSPGTKCRGGLDTYHALSFFRRL